MTSSYRFAYWCKGRPNCMRERSSRSGMASPSPPSPSTSREPGELSPLAHPTSLALTHRRPLDQLTWSARPKWAPTAASFLVVAQNQGKATLKMTLKLAFPPSSSPILSFLNLSRRPLSVVVVCRLVCSYSTPTLRVKHLRSKLTKP
jgi:hypothetical protein